jgi:uncharacterized protein (TIGR00730 family)
VRSLAVFCGSSSVDDPVYAADAVHLAAALASRGLRLVYGGAHVGIMGTLADAALDRGVEVVGVIPGSMTERELAHRGLSTLHVVGSMHERKALMADLADGFVALPGGMGTLDELAEILTWAQLGLHTKPVGLLDTAGYFGPLLAFFDHAAAVGFVRPAHRALLHVADDPAELLDVLARAVPGPSAGQGTQPAER